MLDRSGRELSPISPTESLRVLFFPIRSRHSLPTCTRRPSASVNASQIGRTAASK